MNSYAARLSTLVGLVEVQLSRQLEAGEALVETIDAAPAKADRAARNVTPLAAQGA